MHRRHLESVSAALYGRCFCIVRIQPQLSGKGVLGHSPKRILVPFVRIKGTPRRRAAQTLHPAKSTRRRQATTNLAPAGQAYSLCLCKRLRAADRRDEMIALIFAVNPSVSLAADSLSLRLGHGAALICHWHIIHYRAATSLPLTQGRLWVGAPLTLCIREPMRTRQTVQISHRKGPFVSSEISLQNPLFREILPPYPLKSTKNKKIFKKRTFHAGTSVLFCVLY